MNAQPGEFSFVIAADDPCVAGHFPGNPLVPGVVILEFAARALAAHASGLRVVGVTQAKFAAPLRPLEPCTVDCRHTPGSGSATFRCESAGRLIAAGTFAVRVP